MAFYLVQLPAGSTLRHDGVDRMIVEADDAAKE